MVFARFMVTECVVGPPLSEPLIGQIVLEGLDLIADCANRMLTPDYPSLKLRSIIWSMRVRSNRTWHVRSTRRAVRSMISESSPIKVPARRSG